MLPSVSIIMSIFNGSKYLKESIDSVLSQTFKDFELIIIDDGSTDCTWDLLSAYAKTDNRIKLAKNIHNIGLTRSLNKGLYLSQGKYIARQDDDDISLPMRLEKQVNYLNEHPSIILISSNYTIINSDGNFIRDTSLDTESHIILWNMTFYNFIGGHSQVMFRRKEAIELGGYSTDYPYAQDYDLWLRLNELGETAILREKLIKYRIHNDRITNHASKEQFYCVMTASKKRIHSLINENLPLQQLTKLWKFWCLAFSYDYPHLTTKDFFYIQKQISKIYRGFMDEDHLKILNDHKKKRQIRYIIANRFNNWAMHELSTNHSFLNFIFLSFMIIYWLRFHLSIIEIKQLLLKHLRKQV